MALAGQSTASALLCRGAPASGLLLDEHGNRKLWIAVLRNGLLWFDSAYASSTFVKLARRGTVWYGRTISGFPAVAHVPGEVYTIVHFFELIQRTVGWAPNGAFRGTPPDIDAFVGFESTPVATEWLTERDQLAPDAPSPAGAAKDPEELGAPEEDPDPPREVTLPALDPVADAVQPTDPTPTLEEAAGKQPPLDEPMLVLGTGICCSILGSSSCARVQLPKGYTVDGLTGSGPATKLGIHFRCTPAGGRQDGPHLVVNLMRRTVSICERWSGKGARAGMALVPCPAELSQSRSIQDIMMIMAGEWPVIDMGGTHLAAGWSNCGIALGTSSGIVHDLHENPNVVPKARMSPLLQSVAQATTLASWGPSDEQPALRMAAQLGWDDFDPDYCDLQKLFREIAHGGDYSGSFNLNSAYALLGMPHMHLSHVDAMAAIGWIIPWAGHEVVPTYPERVPSGTPHPWGEEPGTARICTYTGSLPCLSASPDGWVRVTVEGKTVSHMAAPLPGQMKEQDALHFGTFITGGWTRSAAVGRSGIARKAGVPGPTADMQLFCLWLTGKKPGRTFTSPFGEWSRVLPKIYRLLTDNGIPPQTVSTALAIARQVTNDIQPYIDSIRRTVSANDSSNIFGVSFMIGCDWDQPWALSSPDLADFPLPSIMHHSEPKANIWVPVNFPAHVIGKLVLHSGDLRVMPRAVVKLPDGHEYLRPGRPFDGDYTLTDSDGCAPISHPGSSLSRSVLGTPGDKAMLVPSGAKGGLKLDGVPVTARDIQTFPDGSIFASAVGDTRGLDPKVVDQRSRAIKLMQKEPRAAAISGAVPADLALFTEEELPEVSLKDNIFGFFSGVPDTGQVDMSPVDSAVAVSSEVFNWLGMTARSNSLRPESSGNPGASTVPLRVRRAHGAGMTEAAAEMSTDHPPRWFLENALATHIALPPEIRPKDMHSNLASHMGMPGFVIKFFDSDRTMGGPACSSFEGRDAAAFLVAPIGNLVRHQGPVRWHQYRDIIVLVTTWESFLGYMAVYLRDRSEARQWLGSVKSRTVPSLHSIERMGRPEPNVAVNCYVGPIEEGGGPLMTDQQRKWVSSVWERRGNADWKEPKPGGVAWANPRVRDRLIPTELPAFWVEPGDEVFLGQWGVYVKVVKVRDVVVAKKPTWLFGHIKTTTGDPLFTPGSDARLFTWKPIDEPSSMSSPLSCYELNSAIISAHAHYWVLAYTLAHKARNAGWTTDWVRPIIEMLCHCIGVVSRCITEGRSRYIDPRVEMSPYFKGYCFAAVGTRREEILDARPEYGTIVPEGEKWMPIEGAIMMFDFTRSNFGRPPESMTAEFYKIRKAFCTAEGPKKILGRLWGSPESHAILDSIMLPQIQYVEPEKRHMLPGAMCLSVPGTGASAGGAIRDGGLREDYHNMISTYMVATGAEPPCRQDLLDVERQVTEGSYVTAQEGYRQISNKMVGHTVKFINEFLPSYRFPKAVIINGTIKDAEGKRMREVCYAPPPVQHTMGWGAGIIRLTFYRDPAFSQLTQAAGDSLAREASDWVNKASNLRQQIWKKMKSMSGEHWWVIELVLQELTSQIICCSDDATDSTRHAPTEAMEYMVSLVKKAPMSAFHNDCGVPPGDLKKAIITSMQVWSQPAIIVVPDPSKGVKGRPYDGTASWNILLTQDPMCTAGEYWDDANPPSYNTLPRLLPDRQPVRPLTRSGTPLSPSSAVLLAGTPRDSEYRRLWTALQQSKFVRVKGGTASGKTSEGFPHFALHCIEAGYKLVLCVLPRRILTFSTLAYFAKRLREGKDKAFEILKAKGCTAGFRIGDWPGWTRIPRLSDLEDHPHVHFITSGYLVQEMDGGRNHPTFVDESHLVEAQIPIHMAALPGRGQPVAYASATQLPGPREPLLTPEVDYGGIVRVVEEHHINTPNDLAGILPDIDALYKPDQRYCHVFICGVSGAREYATIQPILTGAGFAVSYVHGRKSEAKTVSAMQLVPRTKTCTIQVLCGTGVLGTGLNFAGTVIGVIIFHEMQNTVSNSVTGRTSPRFMPISQDYRDQLLGRGGREKIERLDGRRDHFVHHIFLEGARFSKYGNTDCLPPGSTKIMGKMGVRACDLISRVPPRILHLNAISDMLMSNPYKHLGADFRVRCAFGACLRVNWNPVRVVALLACMREGFPEELFGAELDNLPQNAVRAGANQVSNALRASADPLNEFHRFCLDTTGTVSKMSPGLSTCFTNMVAQLPPLLNAEKRPKGTPADESVLLARYFFLECGLVVSDDPQAPMSKGKVWFFGGSMPYAVPRSEHMRMYIFMGATLGQKNGQATLDWVCRIPVDVAVYKALSSEVERGVVPVLYETPEHQRVGLDIPSEHVVRDRTGTIQVSVQPAGFAYLDSVTINPKTAAVTQMRAWVKAWDDNVQASIDAAGGLKNCTTVGGSQQAMTPSSAYLNAVNCLANNFQWAWHCFEFAMQPAHEDIVFVGTFKNCMLTFRELYKGFRSNGRVLSLMREAARLTFVGPRGNFGDDLAMIGFRNALTRIARWMACQALSTKSGEGVVARWSDKYQQYQLSSDPGCMFITNVFVLTKGSDHTAQKLVANWRFVANARVRSIIKAAGGFFNRSFPVGGSLYAGADRQGNRGSAWAQKLSGGAIQLMARELKAYQVIGGPKYLGSTSGIRLYWANLMRVMTKRWKPSQSPWSRISALSAHDQVLAQHQALAEIRPSGPDSRLVHTAAILTREIGQDSYFVSFRAAIQRAAKMRKPDSELSLFATVMSAVLQ